MKKCNILLIVLMLVSTIFTLTPNVESIEQHEVANGTFVGYIENETVHSGNERIFYSEKDAYVRNEAPDTNYGTNSMLAVQKYTNYNRYYYSFIEFNITEIPDEATITSAKLYLYASGVSGSGNIRVHRAEETWNESTITWNDQPSCYSVMTESESFSHTDDGRYYHWDVIDDVLKYVSGTNTSYGWRLHVDDTSYLWATFYSKERSTTYVPYLSVDYEYRFNGTRSVSSNTEKNNFTFVSTRNYTDDVNLKIPVSSDVRGIVDVTNNTGSKLAIEVNDTTELINNTYWYDSANQYVYIRTINLTYGMVVNWTVNCSYGMNFNIPIPTYKEVGDDIVMSGRITNSSGVSMNVSAWTHIYNSTGVDVVSPVHEWYCFWGNYECTIPTSGLIPGVYTISIEITDPDTGIIFKYGDTLYLSFETPDGVYSNAILTISFYNTNIGLGLIPETFKVYIDDAREYDNIYYGYTGQTINITIRDYYDSVMKSIEHTITDTEEELNLGLTFHEFFFINENDEYFYASFLKENASRWYELVVPMSGGDTSFMLPTGDYTVRVYNADNSTYVSWTETVNRSKAYLIGTDGVSLIIQGQSVIIGDILEFTQDLQDALLPDVVDVCYNTPSVWTKFRYEGLPIGWELVCPAQILTATTINESTNNNFTSYPLIPTTGTSENGTITINHDKLYFAGSGITWLNITFGGSSTNYSYVPSFINPYGADVQINASGNISIIRETEFQQMLLFDWLHRADLNYYVATVPFTNTITSALREVYCYIEYPNEDMLEDETEPRYTTVKVYDVTNGLYLTTGQDFDSGANGIKFQLPSINVSETRSFTCEFYVKSSVETSSDAIVSVDDYNMKNLDDKNYYHLYAQYVNTGSQSFIGSLIIKFNHSIEGFTRAPHSFRVFDNENDRYLFPEEFAYLGEGALLISQDALGSVDPNGARSFDVYFLFTDEDPAVSPLAFGTTLHSPLASGVPILGNFQLIHLIGIVCAYPIYYSAKHEYQHRFKGKIIKERYRLILGIFGMALFLSIIFYLNGY